MKTLALEFASNLFGKISPETKEKLQKVIDNPCEKTWDNAYHIILNGKMKTLWQAVLEVDNTYLTSKPCNEPWPVIPTKETIIKAIRVAVFNGTNEKLINKEAYRLFYS